MPEDDHVVIIRGEEARALREAANSGKTPEEIATSLAEAKLRAQTMIEEARQRRTRDVATQRGTGIELGSSTEAPPINQRPLVPE